MPFLKRKPRERIGAKSPKLIKHIGNLLYLRKRRTKTTVKTALIGGGALLAGDFLIRISGNQSLRENISEYFKATALGTAALGAFAQSGYLQPVNSKGKTYNERIHHSMKMVGKGLYYEARKNPELKSFLEKYRFVYIDPKGRIVGTNRNRILGIGYLRLVTRRILSKRY